MARVFKYKLALEHDTELIEVPDGSCVVHVGVQGNDVAPSLWVLHGINETGETRTRRYRVVGTGMEVDASQTNYVGTCLYKGGQLVWHVFEIF